MHRALFENDIKNTTFKACLVNNFDMLSIDNLIVFLVKQDKVF